jgi:hypothetical protein
MVRRQPHIALLVDGIVEGSLNAPRQDAIAILEAADDEDGLFHVSRPLKKCQF